MDEHVKSTVLKKKKKKDFVSRCAKHKLLRKKNLMIFLYVC